MTEEDQLSLPVRSLIAKICEEQNQPPICKQTRELLASLGEDVAVSVLKTIASSQPIKRSFDGFISWLVNNDSRFKQASNGRNKPTSASKWATSVSPSSYSSPVKHGEIIQTTMSNFQTKLSFESVTPPRKGSNAGHQSSVSNELKDMTQSTNSEQMKILNKLEFRKLFLVLSYIGRKKLDDVMTVEGARAISEMKQMKMSRFESQIWDLYGKKYCSVSDRSQHNWDLAKPRFYRCNVNYEGYHFKGPYFECTRTHLQRSLGDDNVLIVKLDDQLSYDDMHKIAQEGIFVGLRHYQFFVFKDQRKKGKDNEIQKGNKTSSAKCYFIHFEDRNYASSGRVIDNVRRRFMHVHTVSTIEKYMARFSLILSRTIKLQVDFGAIEIIKILDIPFTDQNNKVKHDKEGNVLIHTDGTGFISEDLAMKCPKHFTSAKYITDNNFEDNQELAGLGGLPCQNEGEEASNSDPPLLMQCRLFYNGCAVKGTFLVNKKLKPGTIQVRPSMIKVEMDKDCLGEHFNSLEIVGISCRFGRCFLSKQLIALLSYGRVPTDFFINLLNEALEDARNVFSNRRVALKVATYNDGLDYGFVAQRMISSGIPLNEPYLQHCLSYLKDDKLKKLRGGKIPIGDSFYLMGTADPTGILNYDEVCIIHDHGQIVGKVLVYRHPGLHFGDIHVMKAVHVKEMEEFVGNSKYGIFFSTKGGKSAAYEMSTGDFDGDLYWVSKNAELLENFRPDKPWDPDSSVSPASSSRKPPDTSVELERELFQLFLEANKPSFTMGISNYSWLSFMDRLLTLGKGCDSEKQKLMDKMILLINIYYDAFDAPKSGKKVEVPAELRAEQFPHHMEKGADKSFRSNSVLGQIYDKVEAFRDEALPDQEIWKIPCFDSEPQVGDEYLTRWEGFYNDYRKSMKKALNNSPDAKDVAAKEVIRQYKELLYEADEFEESKKSIMQIYKEALAIYQVTYNHVIKNERRDIRKCGFVWKVAGAALCHYYAWNMASPKDRPMVMLPSVLRDLL